MPAGTRGALVADRLGTVLVMEAMRRVTAVAAAVVAGLGGAAVVASPAGAVLPCQVGEFCVYEHTNFQGRMSRFTTSPYSIVDYYLHDKISSVVNRSASIWILYQHANCSGWWEWVSPGAFYNLAKVHNDATSCIRKLA